MKIKPAFFAIIGFGLPIVFLIIGLLFHDQYVHITQPYFMFLNRIGYYWYVYVPNCSKICLFNLINDAPFLFFFIPIVLIFLGILYSVSDQISRQRFREIFSRPTFRKSVPSAAAASRTVDDQMRGKQRRYFMWGLLSVFFLIIFLIFVLPFLLILL